MGDAFVAMKAIDATGKTYLARHPIVTADAVFDDDLTAGLVDADGLVKVLERETLRVP